MPKAIPSTTSRLPFIHSTLLSMQFCRTNITGQTHAAGHVGGVLTAAHLGVKPGAGAVRLRGLTAAGVRDWTPVSWAFQEATTLELEKKKRVS